MQNFTLFSLYLREKIGYKNETFQILIRMTSDSPNEILLFDEEGFESWKNLLLLQNLSDIIQIKLE